MLTFTPPTDHTPGAVFELLRRSYDEIMPTDPVYWSREEQEWKEFDKAVFDEPDTVGQCVFVALLDDIVVGMASFDPRSAPEYGIIGHNCILPEFRGRGFGKEQVEEVCRRLRMRGIDKAVVTTGRHPFFFPARRMYISCGFKETRRDIDNPRPSPLFKLIEYERLL